MGEGSLTQTVRNLRTKPWVSSPNCKAQGTFVDPWRGCDTHDDLKVMALLLVNGKELYLFFFMVTSKLRIAGAGICFGGGRSTTVLKSSEFCKLVPWICNSADFQRKVLDEPARDSETLQAIVRRAGWWCWLAYVGKESTETGPGSAWVPHWHKAHSGYQHRPMRGGPEATSSASRTSLWPHIQPPSSGGWKWIQECWHDDAVILTRVSAPFKDGQVSHAISRSGPPGRPPPPSCLLP